MNHMPTYNKLVRDCIPEIIEKSGKTFTTRLLSDAEYIAEINTKMGEELTEYIETTTPENFSVSCLFTLSMPVDSLSRDERSTVVINVLSWPKALDWRRYI